MKGYQELTNICMNYKTIYQNYADRGGCYAFTYTAEYATGYLLSALLYLLWPGILLFFSVSVNLPKKILTCQKRKFRHLVEWIVSTVQ